MPLTTAHLRALADQIEQEERDAERELADAETAKERDDARRELAELREEIRKVKGELAEKPAEKDPKPEKEAEPEPEPAARPRQRLTVLDIPRIHNGDDEPDHVEYEDDDGKVQVRQGRKRGVPYGYDVEDVAEAS